MGMTKPFTRFIERRLASPFWLRTTRLTDLLSPNRARFKAPQPDDGLRDRFCSRPFNLFELHENGSVFLCCPTWLPSAVGNLNGQDARDIWNSKRAQEIRRSILDGDYKHCSRELCPLIASKSLPTRAQARKNPAWRDVIDNHKVTVEGRPKVINLSNDRSCNLACPSCRSQRINFTKGRGYQLRKKLQDRLTAAFFSEPSDESFTINVTGSGDPFASRVFREFLLELDSKKFPNLKVALQTNGTLFNEKNWKRLNKIHGNISTVFVSFDAATEATYNITRRGGNWQHLMENVRFLSGLRAQGLLRHLRLDYVVQHANYREMPAFVKLAMGLNVDQVFFSKATNWGTWSANEFRSVCVWDAAHPDHGDFRRIIADPAFANPKVLIGNLAHDRADALRPVDAMADVTAEMA
jgi:sulfatase maturation enzyme AslB (radical SAM superfamily)